jgi:hypothetical protein
VTKPTKRKEEPPVSAEEIVLNDLRESLHKRFMEDLEERCFGVSPLMSESYWTGSHRYREWYEPIGDEA